MPDGGKSLEAFQACLRAPFATLGITTTDTHVTGIRYLAPSVAAKAPRRNSIAFLACVQIQAYLDDPRYRFELPLKLAGTHHRLAVWEAMQRIPPGATRTYGELAKELGSSPRAVGGACDHEHDEESGKSEKQNDGNLFHERRPSGGLYHPRNDSSNQRP